MNLLSTEMKLLNKNIALKKVLCLLLYYSFARYLPLSTNILFGKISKGIRYFLCRRIFKKCGKNVNVERGATFESGLELCIGDNSGIGVNCHVPSNTIIGNNVMMGPECYFLARNHEFQRSDIPIIEQGFQAKKQTIIGNDVWIGRNVLATPGRVIADHSIVAAGCVLTKDYPPHSVIGGNPSKLLKTRESSNRK